MYPEIYVWIKYLQKDTEASEIIGFLKQKERKTR